jgi:hypothetical protein
MTQHMGTQMSLFDRLGGAPAITAAAGLFYRQVLADPLLAPIFRRCQHGSPGGEAGGIPGHVTRRARPLHRGVICAPFHGGTSLRSIQAGEFVPAVISG